MRPATIQVCHTRGVRSAAGDSARRPLPDELAERIQAEILNGTLRPGDRLPTERELAEELQVNRSSVREALKKLEQLRLITIQQGSGIRVRNLEEASFDLVRRLIFQDGRIHREWLRDVLELRDALLPAVARLALARAGPEELQRAARLLRECADPKLAPAAFGEVLRTVQMEFARMSGNQVLIMLTHSLNEQLSGHPLLKVFQHTMFRGREQILPQLEQLADAIESGEVELADAFLRSALRELSAAILAAVDA